MSDPVIVLIVDDNEDDRQLYRRYLEKDESTAYLIVEAESGDKILGSIAETMPHCILLDYSLPGRNGVDVLRSVRAAYPFVPVVMLTGQGSESLVVAAMREGAQNYISKSVVTPVAIQRVIRMAIEHCAMAKRMDEQRASLEVFSRALAHDLKEPVRTIKSYIDLMGAFDAGAEQNLRYFEYIRSAADRMARLIDTVHLFTSLDLPENRLSSDQCDLAAVLEDAKANIAELIRERGAIITGNALPVVNANGMQLLQVLQNLLCNAIHHCPELPVIYVFAVKEKENWIIRVSDNGRGVIEDQREKIFRPFTRLDGQGGQRLGLGLAICKKIVEAHGGTIWCEPGSPKGSIFSFALPAHLGASAILGAAGGATQVEAGRGEEVANVLLVDDNQADIELIQIMLLRRSKLRCNIFIASDGFEALELLHEEFRNANLIDLVLLDINMPGMDGLELLERIRNDRTFERVPVVMCSTSFYDRDISRAKSLGAVDYITKPMEFTKFKVALDKLPSIHLRRIEEGYVLTRAA